LSACGIPCAAEKHVAWSFRVRVVFAFGPVPEETDMCITAWVVPGRAAGWATLGRESGWANL